MKSSAGFKCLKWPPSSNPPLPLQLFTLRPHGACLQQDSLLGGCHYHLPHCHSIKTVLLKPGPSLASLSKLLLPSCIPQNAAVALSGGLGPLSPRGKHPPHKAPNLLFPQSISRDYLKPTEVGVPLMFILASLFSFFFNNQGSRKCGELTAWQPQRNSLGKLSCSPLRFQPLRQASQRNNRLLVVFNLFFCGTFLVQETNLSVQHEGAWEHNGQMVVLIRGLLHVATSNRSL